MSKKTKRQGTRPTPTVTATPVTTSTSASNSRLYEREFNPDYAPVIKDLKRIGILAGSFFAVLIALTFLLR